MEIEIADVTDLYDYDSDENIDGNFNRMDLAKRRANNSRGPGPSQSPTTPPPSNGTASHWTPQKDTIISYAEEHVEEEKDGMVGQMVDNYKIVNVKRNGIHSVMYRLEHVRTKNNEKAVKLYGDQLVWETETKVLLSMKRPYPVNIVKLEDFYEQSINDVHCFLSVLTWPEFDLWQYGTSVEALQIADIKRVLLHVSTGLKALHTNTTPIVHCALRAYNILFFHGGDHESGVWKISELDFAVPRGSPIRVIEGYENMAPEVAKFGEETLADPAIDSFAVGCIAHWLLSGQQIRTAGMTNARWEAFLKNDRKIPIQEAIMYSRYDDEEHLDSILHHLESLLAKNPAQRPDMVTFKDSTFFEGNIATNEPAMPSDFLSGNAYNMAPSSSRSANREAYAQPLPTSPGQPSTPSTIYLDSSYRSPPLRAFSANTSTSSKNSYDQTSPSMNPLRHMTDGVMYDQDPGSPDYNRRLSSSTSLTSSGAEDRTDINRPSLLSQIDYLNSPIPKLFMLKRHLIKHDILGNLHMPGTRLYTLRFACESPEGFHYGEHPGYKISIPNSYTRDFGRYINWAIHTLCYGLTQEPSFGTPGYEALKKDIASMLSMQPDLIAYEVENRMQIVSDMLDASVSALLDSPGITKKLDEKSLLAITSQALASLHRILDTKDDPINGYGGLHPVTVGAKMLWLCDAHAFAERDKAKKTRALEYGANNSSASTLKPLPLPPVEIPSYPVRSDSIQRPPSISSKAESDASGTISQHIESFPSPNTPYTPLSPAFNPNYSSSPKSGGMLTLNLPTSPSLSFSTVMSSPTNSGPPSSPMGIKVTDSLHMPNPATIFIYQSGQISTINAKTGQIAKFGKGLKISVDKMASARPGVIWDNSIVYLNNSEIRKVDLMTHVNKTHVQFITYPDSSHFLIHDGVMYYKSCTNFNDMEQLSIINLVNPKELKEVPYPQFKGKASPHGLAYGFLIFYGEGKLYAVNTTNYRTLYAINVPAKIFYIYQNEIYIYNDVNRTIERLVDIRNGSKVVVANDIRLEGEMAIIVGDYLHTFEKNASGKWDRIRQWNLETWEATTAILQPPLKDGFKVFDHSHVKA